MSARNKAKALVQETADFDGVEPKDIGRAMLGSGLLWVLFMLTLGLSAGAAVAVVGLPTHPRYFGGLLVSAAVAVGVWWFVSWLVGLPLIRSGIVQLLDLLDKRRADRSAAEWQKRQARNQSYRDARSKIGKVQEAVAVFDLLVSPGAAPKIRDALIVASEAAKVHIQLPEVVGLIDFPVRSPRGREVVATFAVGNDAVQMLRGSPKARNEFNERLGNCTTWLGVEYKNSDGVCVTVGRRYLLSNG